MSVTWGSMGKSNHPWLIVAVVIAILYFLSKGKGN